MALWEWLGSLVKGQAKHCTQVLIAPDHVTTGVSTGAALVAEEHYLRLWISEMFLRNDKEWLTERYPTVHSVVGLQYGSQSVELANVAGKSKLDVSQIKLSRSVLKNYLMTSLLPFRGGTVQLDCGLMSMQSTNLLEKFASVVGDFAGKLVNPQVSTVIGLAASVAQGVQSLLGAGEAEAKLYYHTTFSAQGGGDPLVSGFIFVSNQPEGEIDRDKLWVTPDGLRVGDTVDQAQPLEGQDYLLILIDCVQERDDWRQINAIADPLQAAVDARLNGEDDKARQMLAQARIAALKSADLTALDRKRVAAALPKYLESLAPAGDLLALSPESMKGAGASSLERAVSMVTLEQARQLPTPSEEEILAG